MRLIPGKTKVRLELFKGVSLADIAIGAVGVLLILLVFASNFPAKFYVCLAIAFLDAILLVRFDSEPSYEYIVRVFKHIGYKKDYEKIYADKSLGSDSDKDDYAINSLFSGDGSEAPKTNISFKEKKKQDKALFKQEQKILKSKTATKEEKDAVWLARAKRSAENKTLRKEKKETDVTYEPVENITAFTGIKDGYIEYGGEYYGAAIEIPPVEFRFFSPMRRNNSIENGVGRILRSINPDLSANIVKIERPVLFDKYVDLEYDKLDELRKSFERGVLNEDELKTRVEIVYDRINELRDLCGDNFVVEPFYYIVLFDENKKQLDLTVSSAIENLRSGELDPKLLNDKELAVFLKYTQDIDFDEHDIEKISPENYAQWAMPSKVRIKNRNVIVNELITHNFSVTKYPNLVDDGWMASLMTIPATKVVMKVRPMDRTKAITTIDRSLQEIDDRLNSTGIESRKIELATHRESLSQLLLTLQGDNESLLSMNIYVTAYDVALTNTDLGKKEPVVSKRNTFASMKKLIRRYYSEASMRLESQDFNQMQAFIGSQISGYDPCYKKGRGVPSNSIAAAYPWVFSAIMDDNGVKLGHQNGSPVFVDFFRRDSERVNSNMVIVGKSGSGKSYATKSFLTNLAADGAKIFILDPENEYQTLAQNLHGKIINVGNASQGRLNPFHIITALEDEDSDSQTPSNSYATHLQFLEEFFKQSLPDCEKNALEYLNMLIDRMYLNKGITAETNLSKLKPEDYPIFDDLYDTILTEFQMTDNEYIRTMLRSLMNYISKYSAGGRNATIWDGPSTVTTDENFTVFNFQSLLANRNTIISNSQMLLVLKYIDNEIIKNRDYNTKFHANRKIVVVIDEAHVFIDAKYPVALDFMFQLAKRIRKYNGMQIVITQNIKDFIGSEEIARKSTAIINACQYSFIFSLAPNDMDDLCTLYEKAGGINEVEQEQIVSAPRGQAFAVFSPQRRSTFSVQCDPGIVEVFDNDEFRSSYFNGIKGAINWSDYLENSAEKREEYLSSTVKGSDDDFVQAQAGPAYVPDVNFIEMTEEEFDSERKEKFKLDAIEEAKKEAKQEQEAYLKKGIKADVKASIYSENSDDFIFEEISGDDLEKETPVPAAEPVYTAVPRVITVERPAAAAAETEALGDVVRQLAGAVENIGKISRDSIMEEVRMMIAANTNTAETPETHVFSEKAEEAEEDYGFNAENIFADLETDSGFENDDDFDGFEAEPEEEEAEAQPEEEQEVSFNIFDFLASQAEEEELSAENAGDDIEERLENADSFIVITLEELVKYNLGKMKK